MQTCSCWTLLIVCVSQEQGDVRQAVHESLTTLSTAFKSASGLVLVQLEALLHSQLSQVVMTCNCCNCCSGS